MRLIVATILFFSISSCLLAQINEVPLRLRKNLRDRLDDFVFEVESYGRMSSDEEVTLYRALFADEALVFDYITPNYITRNVGREINKPIDQFITDVKTAFPNGFVQSRIIDTNLGEAIDYDRMDWSDPSIQITVALSVIGEYADGGQFSNRPVIDFTVKFDTLQNQIVNFKVVTVEKVSSALSYQKEEVAPRFEKMFVSNGFITWNNATFEQYNGDLFIDNLSISPDQGYHFSFNLIKKIAAPEPEEFSYSIGLGYTLSRYGITLDNYFYSYLETDEDNEAVFVNVTGANLEESIVSELIEVPFRFRYERQFNRIFSIYASIGVNLTYALRSGYSGEGVLSYSGYYPRLNAVIEDAPDFGFSSNENQSSDFTTGFDVPSRNNFGLAGAAEVGFNFELKNGFVLYLGASGFKGVVDTQRTTDFEIISSELDEYNGLFPVINSINFGGYGVQLGVRKRFRSRTGLVKMDSYIRSEKFK